MSKNRFYLKSIVIIALLIGFLSNPALPLFKQTQVVSAAHTENHNSTLPSRDGPQDSSWYDAAWLYRRPVVVSNTSGLSLTNYQVLITLDSAFNFTLAANDGSDLRVTNENDAALPFWIESWDPTSQLARIWVRVDSIPTTGTTIYLYYGNPSASSISNGTTTFEFFDTDWTSLTSKWALTGGAPSVTDGIVSFMSSHTMQTISTYGPGVALSYRGWFKTSDSNYKWGGFLQGVNVPYTYIGTIGEGGYPNIQLTNNTTGSRVAANLGDLTAAFHIYELAWTSSVVRAFVDRAALPGGSLTQSIPNSALPIQLGNYNDNNPGGETLEVDWVFLRKYQEPEPTAAVGSEQSNISADLALTLTDSPDPVMVAATLTYSITITNNGPLPATDVVLTDTLPAAATFVSASPSQGDPCTGTEIVTCELGSIANGGTALVTIIVTPTHTGTLVNTPTVTGGLLDYNTGNNSASASTIVIDPTMADLSITQSEAPDPVEVGSPLTYTLTITNQGPAVATGVTITDTLPATVTFSSAISDMGTCNHPGVVSCTLGTINSGGSAHVTIVVTPLSAGSITNQAVVSGVEADPNPSNNTSSESTRVTAPSLGAVVLVNSNSANFADFQHYIQPYLDHFGVPYDVLDIATAPVESDIQDYALIIIGHRQIDVGSTCLGATPCLSLPEQALITAAVNTGGTGLMNFDNDLSADGVNPRYQFIEDIFNFDYVTALSGSGVLFTTAAGTHYITDRHEAAETISTGSMTLAGISLPLDATALATTAGAPFLAVRNSGSGHAVQWGTYNWMSVSVKGPIFGLDDLVWRSMAWAARKPFVFQGMPPFLTMRVDDESGPFDWIHVANEFGIKPWAGVFLSNIDAAEATDLSTLVNTGQATTAIHAFNGAWFYWNQTDQQIAANFVTGTNWHTLYNIPVSKYVLAHYYQLGSNAFAGLDDWNVECVGTHMVPDTGWGASWIMNGPYRLYETGTSSGALPQYYADYMTVPGHPEYDGRFFNLVTEIRDDLGYEWYPNNDVQATIGHGTLQTKRALDSMALATLFTHDQSISGINMENWRAILAGITTNIASYNPINVTMDYACQYAISKHNSKISSTSYDAASRQVTVNYTGTTEVDTKFYLFMEDQGTIREMWVDVPQFTDSTQVLFTLPGELDHIAVTPAPATVVTGATQQFTATGYDSANNPIPSLAFTWSVANGGGTINSSGLFTAGSTPGTYDNTVVATIGSISGSASVTVEAPALHHFTIQTVSSPQYVGVPFQITVTARDASGNLFTGYTGTAALTTSTGNISPIITGNFTAGSWTGSVILDTANTAGTITATAGGITGISNSFAVLAAPFLDHFNIQTIASPQYAGVPFPISITARDQYNNLFSTYSGTAALTTNTGNISPTTTGTFTAGSWTGSVSMDTTGAAVTITATTGAITGTSNSFAVQPPPTVDHFTIQTIASPQIVNVPFQITIVARDNAGNPLPVYSGHPALTVSLGTVTPAVTGDFSGSSWTGSVSVNTVGDAINITVTDGSATGTSNSFVVQPPPPYYAVTSLRYTQDIDTPFDVTVTAFQTTIDCSSDTNQDPVLTTTSDAAILTANETAGRWTEFLYTPSRPFASIMAGANFQGTLPTMHFYKNGIPNGRYQVIANLYDNASMRYYFGYTSANPAASSVLTEGGAPTTGTQHREYSLGTVDITNNSFNLYTNNADWVSGYPYYIFGWAWIRLAPVEPAAPATVTINLADDAHQDPDLAQTTDANILTTNAAAHHWTEFFYAGRGFPSIMGAAHGLGTPTPVTPTMHFSDASIQNGIYQVYANLYDTNPLRYYYGFTSADPQAAYVDTTGGATGTQHREYSLGTIEITNGNFDLYVNRADRLPGGTYDIFGWAWIRLVPQFTGENNITLSSTSSTLVFDGDGDGIFGETGDNIKALVNRTLTISAKDSTVGQATITATDFFAQQSSSPLYTFANPTAVELNYFRAARTSGGVQLTWETVNEASLAGFNLYRREVGGEFVRLNGELIPPNQGGQPEGSSYVYLDENAQLDRRYEYRLDAIETTLEAGSSALASYWPFSLLLPAVQR